MSPVQSSSYVIGDYVTIRGQVTHIRDENVCVELFSKTDQYEAWVRPNLIVDKVEAPEPEWQAMDVVLDAIGVVREAQRNPCAGTDTDGLRWYMTGSEGWLPTSALRRPLVLLVREGERWDG